MCGSSNAVVSVNETSRRSESVRKARAFYGAAAKAQQVAQKVGPVRQAVTQAEADGVVIPAHVALFVAVEDRHYLALDKVARAQTALIDTTIRRWGSDDHNADRVFPGADTIVLVSALNQLEAVQADYKAALTAFETAERSEIQNILAAFQPGAPTDTVQ